MPSGGLRARWRITCRVAADRARSAGDAPRFKRTSGLGCEGAWAAADLRWGLCVQGFVYLFYSESINCLRPKRGASPSPQPSQTMIKAAF